MKFVSRADWGARYAAGVGPRPIPVAECWLHHTVTLAPDLDFTDLNADSVDDDEARTMRQVEAIGQQRFGYGFSYNLAVMPSGRLYVGCGVRRVGSHTAKRNTRALGIVLVGNYHARELPAPMRATLPRLLVEAHREGWITRPAFDGGHRDLKNTSCPGDHAYGLIAQINREAAVPTAPPVPDVTVILPTPVKGPPDMMLVLQPDSNDVWLCDRNTRHKVVPDERDGRRQAGVPFLDDGAAGIKTAPERRQAILDACSIVM